MTISIMCPGNSPGFWLKTLQTVDPTVEIHTWPDEPDKEAVTFILCWNQPENVWKDYPNLQCICSMGAGVDHLMRDPYLPANVPVVRIIDPALAQAMFEYIITASLYFHRQLDKFAKQQKQAQWHRTRPLYAADTKLGILGLGKLGAYSANRLADFGFDVSGWSRSEKTIDNVMTYAGNEQLDEFLAAVDILICLLPLTTKTTGILNQDLFSRMKKGSYLINVARGGHLVEDDLLQALAEQQLGGAFLDVFNEEPLPETHPFWKNDKIIITPHCSSITDPKSVAPQVIENYLRLQQNKPLINQVDIDHGY